MSGSLKVVFALALLGSALAWNGTMKLAFDDTGTILASCDAMANGNYFAVPVEGYNIAGNIHCSSITGVGIVKSVVEFGNNGYTHITDTFDCTDITCATCTGSINRTAMANAFYDRYIANECVVHNSQAQQIDYGDKYPSRPSRPSDGLSGGAIATIIVGAVVVAGCFGGLGYLHTTGRLLNGKGGVGPSASQDDTQLEIHELS